jgi:superfamily II DNA or RNA helicase
MPLLLPTYPFQISYGPADDRLNRFYLPALERSVRFERTTGFFSSAALALAAAGIVRLIHNGGKMRLLCGAQLAPEDVEAIRRGEDMKAVVDRALVGCLKDPTDQSLRARLEALAWMVANDRLQIRVVLPRDRDGLPLPAAEAREYYHPKEGLFQDAAGNKLAFSGSSNDSENGWQWNYEVFMVHATWPLGGPADGVPPLTAYVSQIERRIRRLWDDEEEGWIALDIPEAARRRLLSYCPSRPPDRDPLEHAQSGSRPEAQRVRVERDNERVLFRFLREAPFLPGGHRVATATSAIVPWPHQLSVARQAVSRFPESFLFCDEVGLGKTVEAGLALRQLVLSGQVRRALLLVPKSVLRQWQEELYEKFVLNVPRYDGGKLLDVFDEEVPCPEGSAFVACPLLLCSSQLAKRKDRQAELLDAEPWDLIIVDEAHHARRKDFNADRFRPNRLLELLCGAQGRPGLKDRTKALYLLTATPMQVHPVEVWDLLKLLGLGGRWGALADNFHAYFAELRLPFERRKWDFLLAMVRDYLDASGELDPHFCAAAERELGLVEWGLLRDLPSAHKRTAAIAQLSERGRGYLHEMIRLHTPVRRYVFRNTRDLLRRYQQKGLLRARIPRREPAPQWIEMKDGPGGERELYERIEEYISDIYQKYEAERKGLGFIMTVYRRRLTSSFYALRKSLERRLAFLKGRIQVAGLADDDDLEQDELELDISEELSEDSRGRFKGELEYIEDFLRNLQRLGTDSKLERLQQDLRSIFQRRDTVLIFTQYTDTMDYLREHLREVYGAQVACYSGRGGERWDGVAFVPRSKEEIKAAFREGDQIRILLCTESASEGLNLQTCGVLINYDMPWNPMRVEQRIGRIDRIGQSHDKVWIHNYFYQDTVEATIYQRLADRINWFENVIGDLQPILHQVARSIERIAMMKGAERRRRLEEEIAAIRQDIEQQRMAALDLGDYAGSEWIQEEQAPPPVTLRDLEEILLGSATLGKLFRPDPDLAGVYSLNWQGTEHKVTFARDVFDNHPYTVEFLSYGSLLLDELLAYAGDPRGSDEPCGIGLYWGDRPVRMSLFVHPAGEGVAMLQDCMALRQALDDRAGRWTAAQTEAASRALMQLQQGVRQHLSDIESAQQQAHRLALQEEGRTILIRAALIELARTQNLDLFAHSASYGFGPEAVRALRRHGAPFKALLTIAGPDGLSAEATDPYYEQIRQESEEGLSRRWETLKRQGQEAVQKYAALMQARGDAAVDAGAPVRVFFFPGVGEEDARSAEQAEGALERSELRNTAEELSCAAEARPKYGNRSGSLLRCGSGRAIRQA